MRTRRSSRVRWPLSSLFHQFIKLSRGTLHKCLGRSRPAPDRGDFVVREQAVPDRQMRNRH